MNKVAKFSLITVWIIGSRAYDAWCTYQYTPDLSQEANPLVSLLGMSWAPLLTVIGILMLYTTYAFYQRTFHSYTLSPSESGFSFQEFATFLYFGRKEKWASMFYKRPGNFKRFTHYMGIFMTRCLVFAGIVSPIMWLLLNNSATYQAIHTSSLIYTILVLGGIGIIYYGKRQLYQVYQTTPSLVS